MSKKSKQKKGMGNPSDPGYTVERPFSDQVPTVTSEVAEHRDYSKKQRTKEPYVYKPCADSHPPLDLGNGLSIHGGAANSPVVKDADIYVSLDRGKDADPRAYPWNGGQFIYFPITDMSAPSDAAEFKKLITWLAEQIKAGHKVHVGCIGGHGRTGTLFAALVKEMTGNVDAIQYVRDHYCPKSVESSSQVDFLVKHYGLTRVKGAKTYDDYDYKGSKKGFTERYPDWIYSKERDYDVIDSTGSSFIPRGHAGNSKKFNETYGAVDKKQAGDAAVVDPAKLEGNIWGVMDDDTPETVTAGAPAGTVTLDKTTD